MKILVTGGAGFIGSHLVDKLLRLGHEVVVLDNLSSGCIEFIKHNLKNKNFKFIKGDVTKRKDIKKALRGCDKVFHLAANPDIRIGSKNTKIDFKINITGTYNLLEEMMLSNKAKFVGFTSTSVVYGEAKIMPTPEKYGPLIPISLYGGSKLSCEALISAFCHMFGMHAINYRLANIIGPRCTHGVIYDFIRKLKKNPNKLEILGDGTQTKSYLYVSDCIDAMILALKKFKYDKRIEIYNMGSDDKVNVKRIAEIIIEEMGLEGVKFEFTGGVEGGRGWKGDVKEMLLSTQKIKDLGWRPKYNSEDAVRETAKKLLKS